MNKNLWSISHRFFSLFLFLSALVLWFFFHPVHLEMHFSFRLCQQLSLSLFDLIAQTCNSFIVLLRFLCR